MTEHAAAELSRIPEAHARPVAAGGWRRAALGLAVGSCAGLLLTAVLAREDGEVASPSPRGSRWRGWRPGG